MEEEAVHPLGDGDRLPCVHLADEDSCREIFVRNVQEGGPPFLGNHDWPDVWLGAVFGLFAAAQGIQLERNLGWHDGVSFPRVHLTSGTRTDRDRPGYRSGS